MSAPSLPVPDLTGDDTPRRIHVVGIGGAGMSAIATVLSALGHRVSGSDFKESPVTARLVSLGVRVNIGHRPENVAGADVVAISSAVRPSNPEVQAATEAGVPVLQRAEILGMLTRRWRTMAISGTHGKTTTSSMLAVALDAAGLSPSYLVGGDLNESGTNASVGSGEWLVCEADESDKTFLTLGAEVAVVTNVEADHLENYGDLAALEAAFHRFLREAPGPRVVGLNDSGAARVSGGLECVGVFVDGFTPAGAAGADGAARRADAKYVASNVRTGRNGATFRVAVDGVDAGEVPIRLPGLHNVANALTALATACEIGAPFDAVAAGLAGFTGVGRRFDFRGEVAGVTLVDDYAHLPTEVAAAVDAALSGGWPRVLAVFQPHLYSRTANFASEFGEALSGADLAFVTDVFGAREDPVPGVTGELVAKAVIDAGGESQYVAHRRDVAAVAARELRPGDVCISIGAGDITSLADELAPLLDAAEGRDPVSSASEELSAALSTPPQRDLPLAPLTTYKVGGSAAIFVEPHDEAELEAVRDVVERNGLPVLVMGRGSNMLVSDGGFPGIALRLGAGFNWIEIDGVRVRAGSATPLPFLSRQVGKEGLTGLEFGVGIPASVGGSVRMNAGGHGAETSSVLRRVRVLDLVDPSLDGERSVEELDLSYRHSSIGPSQVVLWAEYELAPGDPDEIRDRLTEIVRWRKDHHPAGEGNAGSVFTNPPGDSAGRLVDAAGCKGLRVGGAYVSEKHANFIMAEPWARAADVYAVIQAVRARVDDAFGVDLTPEVRLVGEFDS